MTSRVLTLIVLICLLGLSAHAESLCERQNLGWHFYCDPKKQEEQQTELKEVEFIEAQAELEQIQRKLENLKVLAVMKPTPENLKNYITFQKEQLDRAGTFAKQWQQVVWQNPEIDYMVKHPISSVGNDLNSEVRNQQTYDTLASLNNRYGLFFFYSSKCIFCLKFSPILKAFAAYHKLEVMPVSMDGGVLPDWPKSSINRGEAERFGMADKPVPALILFDSQTHKIIPVGFGLMTMDELEERILRLVTQNNKRNGGGNNE